MGWAEPIEPTSNDLSGGKVMNRRIKLLVLSAMSLMPMLSLQMAPAKEGSDAGKQSVDDVQVVHWRERLTTFSAQASETRRLAIAAPIKEARTKADRHNCAANRPQTLAQTMVRPAELLWRYKESGALPPSVDRAIDGFAQSASKYGKAVSDQAVQTLKWVSDMYGQFSSCPTATPTGQPYSLAGRAQQIN